MNLLEYHKLKFVPIHIFFWIGVWFFFLYFFSYNSSDTMYISWFSSFLLPATMITSYTFVYYLIPQYLLTRRYKLFGLYTVYTLVFSTYFILLTLFGSFIFLSKLKINNVPPMSRNFVFVLILIYLVVGFVSFISLLQHNFKTLSKNKELENRILETQLELKNQELSYLKKQIHPHFLFNTLNTIYGFALKKSEQTPEIILKLSNLLDYILYQVQKPIVSLEEELLHIEEYVALENIRFKDTLDVSFVKNIDRIGHKIPPMLLIPFVENAFKHGGIVNDFLSIKIDINIKSDLIEFKIENTVIQTKKISKNHGIGLINIHKRLELIYKDQYDLTVEQNNGWFMVCLKIPIQEILS